MEKTLVIFKPGTIQRGLIGEIIHRFERKGLQICGLKMIQLTDELLNEHYAHIAERPFFQRVKTAMMATPVLVCCLKGLDAVKVVREMAGATNGREAKPGTIRGDFSMSGQWNVIHSSDSVENSEGELMRFFKEDELFEFPATNLNFIYSTDEV